MTAEDGVCCLVMGLTHLVMVGRSVARLPINRFPVYRSTLCTHVTLLFLLETVSGTHMTALSAVSVL